MPLTEAEYDKIAKKVWQFVNEDLTDKQAYWFLRNNDALTSKVDEAVWSAPSRTLTSTGGPPVLSDADVARIAEATADLLAERLGD
jgi:hypothetical protein